MCYLSLLTAKSIDLVVACDGFFCIIKSPVFCIVATLIIEVHFKQFLFRTAVWLVKRNEYFTFSDN